MLKVLLGLGGNLGDPAAAIAAALSELDDAGQVSAVSRIWKTRPVGPEQPDFSNAAAVINWPAGPGALLARCRQLEIDAGRNRETEQRWGPRVLDLDLLVAERIVCVGPELELPHPRFHERRFALEPAAEIAPGWRHQLLGHTIEELLAKAREQDPHGIIEVLSFEL